MVAFCAFPRIPLWLRKQMLLLSEAGGAEGIKALVYGIADTRKASTDQLRRTLTIPEVRSHVFKDLREQIKIETLPPDEKRALVEFLEELGLDQN